MDYREKAVRCVRETVLPVQAAQFRACGCDLDAQYRKYGDTESFFAKVLQPGRLYEVGYPKCVCPEVLGGETADAAHCECSRQSVLYILEQLLPERHITSRPWRRCWAAGPAAGSPLQWSSSGKCKQEPGAVHRAPALTYRDYSSSWGLSSSSRPFRSNSSFSPQLGQMTSPSSKTDSSK